MEGGPGHRADQGRRVKVLAVTPLYPPHSPVGAWVATHLFLRHLARIGHTVTAFQQLARRPAFIHEGVTVESALRGRNHALTLGSEADVIVSHAGDSGLSTEVAATHGKPHVRLVHGAGHLTADGPDLLVFNSRTLHACSPHESPSIVCHPPTTPADHRVEHGSLVTIVNCSKAKGIKTAWRAAEAMPANAFLAVKGGYGQQVVPRAPNVETVPAQRDMREVWKRTRILLMPSQFETWGMVGIEAMCSGIPVIAHPTPGLVESLGPAGIFCDRDDTDAWVREIRRLDDPDEYEQASRAALKRIDELDPHDSLTRFTAALESLAA